MKHYFFCPDLIVRTPLYSSQTPICLSQILQTEEFKTAVFLSSRSFFKELSKKNFKYEELTQKQKASVRKYVNRSRFRSTPFGLFSSVAVLPWSAVKDTVILSPVSGRVYLDFEWIYRLWQLYIQNKTGAATRLKANASFYETRIDLRFLKKHLANNEPAFSVESLDKTDIVKSILRFCSKSKSSTEIADWLIQNHGATASDANAFIMDLVDQQILMADTEPNITGPDYTKKMSSYLEHASPELASSVNQFSNDAYPSLKTLLDASDFFDSISEKPTATNHFYTISQRSVVRGGLDQHYQKTISEGLYCLNLLSGVHEKDDLASFRKAFQKKFDSREVPLLQALDPQFGLGYGDLDHIKITYGFSSTGYNRQPREQPSDNPQTGITAFFLNHWQSKTLSPFELEITDGDLQMLEKENNSDNTQHPPSISVMFRTIGDQVFIESAGSTSALVLTGRFGFMPAIFEQAKLVAEQEQKINNEVLFAEVAHLCNLHTANINRRPHFYDYEIPVLTGSILPEEKQIALNDLFISVVNEEIILRSGRLNKRIIPRLSSAFNYTRNSFPVFRFLCDLQHQDLKTAFQFSLASLIPGLKFYPRIRYRCCILQLAEWHLDSNDFKLLRAKGGTYAAFQNLAKEINLPRFFSYSVGDNFLVFDSEKKEDIDLLVEELPPSGKIILKEFPFFQDDTIKTNKKEALIAQYVVALYKSEPTYKDPLLGPVHCKSLRQKNDTADWIYCKLYCHPLSTDCILSEHLLPLIKRLQKRELIKKWFWVRYSDPAYHLRIRIKPIPGMKKQVLHRFTAEMDALQTDGLIDHFISDVYNREIRRYSPQLMESVENIFQASSELIASELTQTAMNDHDEKTMMEAVLSMYITLDAFDFTMPEQISLTKSVFDNFFREFKGSWELKGEMEKLYKRLNGELDRYLANDLVYPKYEPLKTTIIALTAQYRSNPVQISLHKLCADIIHMHLNRIFIHQQRYFEMVSYYLLNRVLNSKKFRLIS